MLLRDTLAQENHDRLNFLDYWLAKYSWFDDIEAQLEHLPLFLPKKKFIAKQTKKLSSKFISGKEILGILAILSVCVCFYSKPGINVVFVTSAYLKVFIKCLK